MQLGQRGVCLFLHTNKKAKNKKQKCVYLRDGVPEATNKTKRHLQHLTTWGRGTLHHDYEPLKEEGSRTGHTHRSSWKGGQSSLHPGRLPPAYRAGAEPRRGHLIWRCGGRESKKSHGRAAGTRLGPLRNKQTNILIVPTQIPRFCGRVVLRNRPIR